MAELLRLPAVAANTEEAVLADWPVAENTPFPADLAIATVETEKAVVDVPAARAGVILKTLVPSGATVRVGDPIAVLGRPGEAVQDLNAVLSEPGVGEPRGRVFSSPLARKLAREAGLPFTDLVGTGPGGRIVRRDVQKAQAERAARVPAEGAVVVPRKDEEPEKRGRIPAAGFLEVPHHRLRRAVAARLTESQQVPHFTVRGRARVDKLLRLRRELNRTGTERISVTDLLVTAAARAHVAVPDLNVIWQPDVVRQFTGVDLAVAVATERGLVTPVLRGIERMTVSAVAVATADLLARARSGRLRQDELEGGTLTVSNLGGYGIEEFTAVINPPQAAILAVGAARPETVVRKGKPVVATVMAVTLTVDHRPVDGVVAARWMAAYLSLLEHPVRILA